MRYAVVACALALATPAGADSTPADRPAFPPVITGHGPPVILIPGLGCPGSVGNATAKHLAEDHEVHVLQLAGFAGNPAIDRPIPSATRDDVIRYIREHQLDHPAIVGHSMGGFVAIWIAETAPDLIGPVVVVDAGPTLGGGNPSLLPYAKAKVTAYKTMQPSRFEVALRWRYSAMFGQPQKYDPIITAVTRSDQGAFGDALFELYTVDLRPQLAKIKVPVLSVLAGNSSIAQTRAQMKPVTDHTVVLLPTRHFVMQDDFDGFAKILDTFLDRTRLADR